MAPAVEGHQGKDSLSCPTWSRDTDVVTMPQLAQDPSCLWSILGKLPCEVMSKCTHSSPAVVTLTDNAYINKHIGLIIPNSAKIRPKCSIFHVFPLIKNEMKEKKKPSKLYK